MKRPLAAFVLAAAAAHVHAQTEQTRDMWQRVAGFEVLDRQDAFAMNLGGTHFGLVVARRP